MPRRSSGPSRYVPHFTGALWCTLWILALYSAALPWRDLGGLVSELLRWLHSFVLGMGLVVGFTIGGLAREAALAGREATHAGLYRWILLPLAGLTATLMLLLRGSGNLDPIGVALSGFLAVWAGIDLSVAALPLLRGRRYRFREPVEPQG